MTLLPVHIVGGSIGIIAGFLALATMKGAPLHRKAGMVFVCGMVTLAGTGAVMSVITLNRGNLLVAGLTLYMVATALLTTRRRETHYEWRDLLALTLGLGVTAAALTFGRQALASTNGQLDRYPALFFFVFGSIALLSVMGDVRMMIAGGFQGRPRIVRHLWRMCFATFIASGSFFLGQAKVIPKPIRIVPVLTLLALLPLLAMAYWLVRVRFPRYYARLRMA